MNCNQIRELLPELAIDHGKSPRAEVGEHIASCEKCALHLRELQKTMAVMDEWQAPEPSAYFDTRMQALLREEMARPQASWFAFLRHPAWATSLAALIFAAALGLGVGVTHKSYIVETGSIATKPPSLGLPEQPALPSRICRRSTAMMTCTLISTPLDDLQVQSDVTANP
jgi:Predicted transmembrane transcriptional regulator (anti-sigma factor)